MNKLLKVTLITAIMATSGMAYGGGCQPYPQQDHCGDVTTLAIGAAAGYAAYKLCDEHNGNNEEIDVGSFEQLNEYIAGSDDSDLLDFTGARKDYNSLKITSDQFKTLEDMALKGYGFLSDGKITAFCPRYIKKIGPEVVIWGEPDQVIFYPARIFPEKDWRIGNFRYEMKTEEGKKAINNAKGVWIARPEDAELLRIAIARHDRNVEIEG